MLSVPYACGRCHTYMLGKSFITESDHRQLKMIMLRNMTAAPPILQGLHLSLRNYDLTIKYRPSREMILADSLLRLL